MAKEWNVKTGSRGRVTEEEVERREESRGSVAVKRVKGQKRRQWECYKIWNRRAVLYITK